MVSIPLVHGAAMTATEYREVLAVLGLSQVGVARLLRVNPVTSRRWARYGVTGTAEILLRLMVAGKVKPQHIAALDGKSDN